MERKLYQHDEHERAQSKPQFCIELAKPEEITIYDVMRLAESRMSPGGTQEAIHKAIVKTIKLTEQAKQEELTDNGISNVSVANVDATFDEHNETVEQYNWIVERSRTNNLLVARDDRNKIVGCIGMYKTPYINDENGARYWMITAAAVLPEMRRNGVYRKLSEAVEKEIQNREPGAPIYRMSKEKGVIENCRKLCKENRGWKELRNDETNHIRKQRIEKNGPDPIIKEDKEGYIYFAYSPSTSSTTAA